MMLKIFLPLKLLVCMQLVAVAQQPAIKQLLPGDTIPQVPLQKLLYNDAALHSLQQLKGKWILLDFWNVSCRGCIAIMPRLDSIQQQLSNQLQVIMVTRDTEKQVKQLFDRIRVKRPRVPMVVEDSLLNRLFPHEGEPMNVFINPAGMVKYIAAGTTTIEEVAKLVNHQPVQLSLRMNLPGLSAKNPLLKLGDERLEENLQMKSVFLQGLHAKMQDRGVYKIHDTASGKLLAIRAINATPFKLYNEAWNLELYGFQPAIELLRNKNRRLLVETPCKDFFPPAQLSQRGAWEEENLYSYEIAVAPARRKDLFRFMQQDLDRFLPYEANMEERWMECIVLSGYPQGTKIDLHPSGRSVSLHKGDKGIEIKNSTLPGALAPWIMYQAESLQLPFVNEITCQLPVSLTLHSDFKNFRALAQELQEMGLKLERTIRLVKVVVIRERG